MREYHRLGLLGTLAAAAVLLGAGCGSAKQSEEVKENPSETPAAVTDTVSAVDQDLKNGSLVVASATVGEPSFVAIHADVSGQPGDVIGKTQLTVGANKDVVVTVDEKKVTAKVYALLYLDKGTVGTFEFPGADVPATDGTGNIIMAAFAVTNTPAAEIKKDEVKKDEVKKDEVKKN